MTVIGLHHREAERIARQHMPSLDEAKAIVSRYTSDEIQSIASRGFCGEVLSDEEVDAVLAYTRVRFAE